MSAVQSLRTGLTGRHVEVMGAPSPVVPVFVGRDDVARTAARLLAKAGVITNLIEFPAVSRATARFRLQAMSTHTRQACETAAARVADAIAEARALCAARGVSAAA
jgi:7-keto-8-aminopelargonate synthetase-like enzyme